MEELSYVLTKDFVSCVHVRFYFFTAAYFHLAASICHFLTTAIKVSYFSCNLILLPSPFCVIHVSVKKELEFFKQLGQIQDFPCSPEEMIRGKKEPRDRLLWSNICKKRLTVLKILSFLKIGFQRSQKSLSKNNTKTT